MNIEQLYSIYLQYPSVQTDTRKLKNGDLFFALKGANFNGNEFAAQAIDNGAAYAIIDEQAFEIKGKTILVQDVLQTLQQLAKYHRQQFSIPFIAITGSNGKTTTKELIHITLSGRYKTYTTEGNLNNHIGVPLTILKIREDAEIAIIEMGANHQREIAFYCSITLPTHGLITNCGKAHLEGFGSVEGVRKGKGELFDFLRENNGTAFVMWDYSYLQEMSQGIKQIITYGTEEGNVRGSVLKSDSFLSVQFSKGFSGNIQTQLVGSYNLPNVLAAVTIGRFFNVAEDLIRKSIESYVPSNSRSQMLYRGSSKIILDAYNANPSSMRAAIDNFSKAEGDGKILVLGAMAELGNESLQEHLSLVQEIAKHSWKDVILVGGDFLCLKHPYHSFKSSTEAGQWLKEQNIQHSYFLIKGSRSTQMERVLEFL